MTTTQSALSEALLPAQAPCPHFRGCCRDVCKWKPKSGFIPRGFGGATGSLSDVRLVLVTAEPGDPADGESYEGSPSEMVRGHLTWFRGLLEGDLLRRGGRPAPFHRNLRCILDLCWPEQFLQQQLEQTWFTNAVLCSLPKPRTTFPRDVEEACVRTHLQVQLALIPHAYVLALGDKAQKRLQRHGVRVDGRAQHPSARPNTDPEKSWEAAADKFHAWLATALSA